MKFKLFILTVFIVALCGNVIADPRVSSKNRDINSVNVGGFDCAVAKGQRDIIITAAEKAHVQNIVDVWEMDPNLVMCITGFADGNPYGGDDDAMNPSIGLGRCGLGFKLTKECGATDLSRMRFFVEEFDERGPEFRGFSIRLESSAWASASDFVLLASDVRWNSEVVNTLQPAVTRLGLGFSVINARTTAAEDEIQCLYSKVQELEDGRYILKAGVGLTFLEDYPYSPTFNATIGRDNYSIEIEMAHSLSSKSTKMAIPYGNISNNGEFKTSTKFTSTRLAYLLSENFMDETDLLVKVGWHWQEYNVDGYSGYYKRHDGPEFGVGILGPLNRTNLEFSMSLYWYPAKTTVYPDPTQSWDSGRVRLSLNILKTI